MLKIKTIKTLHGSNGEMNLDIDLEIKEGEFVALSGQSGSGKTTLLRILAGLEDAEGTIDADNRVWLDKPIVLPPQKRKIGFVFQDYALFDNMTVLGNLLFIKNDKRLANRLLDVVELSKLKNRYPASLSGGQKQRVSLCRAIMNAPRFLFMDEPFSALDSNMRTKLQDEIVNLNREFGVTVIMVTHDLSEIYRLASRVILLDNGKVIDDGTPKEVMMKKDKSLDADILELVQYDSGYIVKAMVGQQIIEIRLPNNREKSLSIGYITPTL
jgi:molybdate transport system ATP-binding protein